MAGCCKRRTANEDLKSNKNGRSNASLFLTHPIKKINMMQYQVCPKCQGQGVVSKPPGLAAEVTSWAGTESSYQCDVCNGFKVLLIPKAEAISLDEQRVPVSVAEAARDKISARTEASYKRWPMATPDDADRYHQMFMEYGLGFENGWDAGAAYTSAGVPELDDSDFKYPSYEEAGGNKKWDEMTELEQAKYDICKLLNALAIRKNTIKRLREKQSAGEGKMREDQVMDETNAIKVIVQNRLPHIDGRQCSYETEKIRSRIQELAEVNSEFVLPKKYTYVITEVNGFAKIIKKPKA